jgi:N-acetylmuramoyl-L-alanine amidase
LSSQKLNIIFSLPDKINIRKSSNKNEHRIVFDIDESVYKILKLDKQIEKGYVRVNLLNKSNTLNTQTNLQTQSKTQTTEIKHIMKNNTLPQNVVNKEDNQEHITNKEIDDKDKIVIAIDAGHGGKDPGTIGSLGVPEKTITLMYARTLKEKLIKSGFKVVMIRDSDIFIPLERRVEIARNNKADLFISIHADNAPSQNAEGMTIYTMESLKIKDENWSGFYKKEYVPSEVLKCKDKNVSDILIDISHKSTKSKTMSLVDKMLQYFKEKKLCTKCKHKSKSLAVLRGFDMQSFLIEVGYVSNFNDELKIISASYIENITNEISNFLYNHFYSNKVSL